MHLGSPEWTIAPHPSFVLFTAIKKETHLPVYSLFIELRGENIACDRYT